MAPRTLAPISRRASAFQDGGTGVRQGAQDPLPRHRQRPSGSCSASLVTMFATMLVFVYLLPLAYGCRPA